MKLTVDGLTFKPYRTGTTKTNSAMTTVYSTVSGKIIAECQNCIAASDLADSLNALFATHESKYFETNYFF